MIRITIIAIATFVLGLAAFTGVDHYTGAQAAPPPKTPTPTPGPVEPLHILEQNLDTNGNIKVAQQGPVDVNVLSQPAITAVLFDSEPFGVGEWRNSSAVVVDGCRSFRVFVDAPSAYDQVLIQWSLDGGVWFNSDAFVAYSNLWPTVSFAGFGPQMRVRLRNNAGSVQTISAWVHCVS